MTHFDHRYVIPELAGNPAHFGQPGIETGTEHAESRYPSILALAAAGYLLSVPLLSAAERLSASWLPQAVGVGVVLAWLVFGVVAGRRVVMPKPILLYIAWFLWTTSGFLISDYPEFFLTKYITTAKVVVITWVCCQCVRTRADLLICFLVAGSASLIIFYVGVDEILRAAAYEGEFVQGRVEKGGTLIRDPNSLAITTVTLLIANLICFLSYRSIWLKLLALAPIPCAMYLLAASGSRTGMVGLLIAGGGDILVPLSEDRAARFRQETGNDLDRCDRARRCGGLCSQEPVLLSLDQDVFERP